MPAYFFEQVQYSPAVTEFRCTNHFDSSVYVKSISAACALLAGIIYLTITGLVHLTSSLALAILPIILIAYIHILVTEESITVVKNFGVQHKIKFVSTFERKTFIEVDKLDRVFIHEYIYRSEVKFSIAILAKGDNRLLLSFKHLYPGFQNLQKVNKYLNLSLNMGQ